MTAMPVQSLGCKQYDSEVHTKDVALAARLGARERELLQKKELLRWKQKTWEQEQVSIKSGSNLQARTPYVKRLNPVVDVHKSKSVATLPVDGSSEANTYPSGLHKKYGNTFLQRVHLTESL